MFLSDQCKYCSHSRAEICLIAIFTRRMPSKCTCKSSSDIFWFITVGLLAPIVWPADGMAIEPLGEKNRLVALGQAVFLVCTFTPDPGQEVKYGWEYKDLCSNTELIRLVYQGQSGNVFGGNFSFTPVIPVGESELPPVRKSGNTTLTIHDSSSILTATRGSCSAMAFICLIVDTQDEHKMNTSEIRISLYDPARIQGSAFEHLRYVELSNVTLACKATGIPAPSIRWTFTQEDHRGPKALPTGFFEHLGPLPSFTATAASAGNYTCFAYNNFGNSSKTVQVSVASKPIVHSRNHREIRNEDCYASLVCYAQSIEPITAIWWQDSNRLVVSDEALDDGSHGSRSYPAANATGRNRFIMKKPLITSSNYTSELLVRVTRSDYGTVYSCHFNNSFGASSANVEIIESQEPMPTLGKGQKTYCNDTSNDSGPSSSTIPRASILLRLLLGFLLHNIL